MRPELRAKGDEELYQKLVAEPAIERAVKANKEEKNDGVRRRLLARSVRLTPRIMPRLDSILKACRQHLALDAEIETYVYADGTFNAACVKPEDHRVLLMFSSGLLESFDDQELAFVAGHELGHHMFAHHDIPLQQLSNDSALSAGTVLELYAWSRYAEISADRAGLVCTPELEGVARAFFKLSSGLKSGITAVHAEDLIEQISELKPGAADNEQFSTHPFSPLRLRAAKSFVASELAKEGGRSRTELELETQELMGLMQPTYLDEKSDTAEAMRRLLRAGGVRVAAVSGGISSEEIAQLERFFGAGSFSGKINTDALARDLDRRLREVKEIVPPLRRMQVMRDLCLIALADGRADEAERIALEEIARAVDVDVALVTRTLDRTVALD